VIEETYCFIKNSNVINTVIFSFPSKETLSHFKNEFNLDEIVPYSKNGGIGSTYDGNKFWLPQPYPSWIKNEETNEWEAPIPYPAIEEGSDEQYIWDESTISWLLLPPSN
jgi:hypothetical protein